MSRGGARLQGSIVAGLVAAAVGVVVLGGGPASGTERHGAGAGQAGASSDRTAVERASSRGTAAYREGSTGEIVIGRKRSRTLMGSPSRISPQLAAQSRSALRASDIVKGRRPDRRMWQEPYVPQNGCYAMGLPGVAAFRDMLLTAYPRTRESLSNYNITRGCNTPGVSEHEEGRALDFEARIDNPQQYAQARSLLKYLTRNKGYHARRWGIMYIIYNRQIWAQYRPSWRWMSNRGDPTANHQDHIHFSFTWNGAVKRSAYWTGRVRSADRGPCVAYRYHFAPVMVDQMLQRPRTWGCPAVKPIGRNWHYGPSIMYWQAGERVRWLQQFLSEAGTYRAEVVGSFGELTFNAVRQWQATHRLPQTGVWDPVTQNASGRVVMQRSATTITGWPTGAAAADGAALSLPVTVTADGSHGREMVVQARQAGGKWETLSYTKSDGAGAATLEFAPRPGIWDYRVAVWQSSRYGHRNSGVRTLTVPDPVPSASPSPSDAGSASPTPDPSSSPSDSALPSDGAAPSSGAPSPSVQPPAAAR